MGASYSKKAAKAALKKQRMDRSNKKGQRGTGGGGGGKSSSSNNNNNNTTKKGVKSSGSLTTASSVNSIISYDEKQEGGSTTSSSRMRRKMKISISEESSKTKLSTTNLNSTPKSRTRPGTRGGGGGGEGGSSNSSPAGLHGRTTTPLKKSAVAPAKTATPKSGSLNRFGFRNSGLVKSGDSTDSVNSILSDVQTVTSSDSNSNLFDLCDGAGVVRDEYENSQNSNSTTNRLSGDFTTCDNSRIQPKKLNKLDNISPLAKVNNNISNNNNSNTSKTSSNITQSNRITAHTRQLPKPQSVSVKASNISPKVQNVPAACNIPKTNNSVSLASSARTKSPSIRSLLNTPVKTTLHPSPKATVESIPKITVAYSPSLSSKQSLSSPGVHHTQRISRDSESSTKSTTELDSGLGSSSESDKIRGSEGEADTLDMNHVESNEDISDVWLKKRQDQQKKGTSGGTPKRPLSTGKRMDIQFSGTSSFETKKQNLQFKSSDSAKDKVSPIPSQDPVISDKKPESCKDKRDSTITYGMARQKFAPYSRSRYGYGYQSSGSPRIGGGSFSVSPNTGSSINSNLPSPGITKIAGTPGLVRNRVAMLETPQTKKAQLQNTKIVSPLYNGNVKKPLIRPTSLEKTPILVKPVTEKMIELSKPVCRKLEYSEDRTGKGNEAQKDMSLESELQEGKVSSPVIEDILIVGSVEVEVETHKNSDVFREKDNYGSFYESNYSKIPSIVKSDHAFKDNKDYGIRISERKTPESEKEKKIEDKVEAIIELVKEKDSEPLKLTPETPVEAGLIENTESEKHKNPNPPITPDDSGIKIISPQSESSFEILESLSETIDDLASTDDTKKDIVKVILKEELTKDKMHKYLNAVCGNDVIGLKKNSSVDLSSSSDEATTTTVAQPSTSVSKPTLKPETEPPVKSGNEGSTTEDIKSSNEDTKLSEHSQEMLASIIKAKMVNNAISMEKKRPALGRKPSVDLRNASMESSMESHKSLNMVNAMTESGEHSSILLSGKCTPTLNSARSDMDQDFLIDDEIADQPGLMFGGSTMASSFFTDDGLFDDLPSSPPSHAQLKQVMAESSRSRADSVDTASSVGDDLMLDYFDLDDVKTGGYEEEVLSPDASEIFSEWTAMMAQVSSAVAVADAVAEHECVSRESSSGTGSIGGGGSGGGNRHHPHHLHRSRILSNSSDTSLSSSPDHRRQNVVTVLRPPRQGSVSEADIGGGGEGSPGGGGGIFIDRTAYHYMCQDVTSLKTMLLRLRRVLQAADTINPFDSANLRNSLYLSLSSNDRAMSPSGNSEGDKDSLTPSFAEVSQDNIDLRRQVVLLQQQLEDRDRTIRLLQQQLAQSIDTEQQQQQQLQQQQALSGSSDSETNNLPSAETAKSTLVNAATQTDRLPRSTALTGSSLARAGSTDDGLGPTVSSEINENLKEEHPHLGGNRERSTSAPDCHHNQKQQSLKAMVNQNHEITQYIIQ